MSHTEHRKTRTLLPSLMAVLLLALVSAAGQVLAAGLSATLDRTRVAEGEAVVLTLATSADGGVPDWSPLQQDFDLLGQGQSTQMRMVNGRSSSSREWRLTLLPRRTGSIEIPPIRLGGLASEVLRLEVLPAAQAAAAGIPQPVLLEVEAAPRQPYVQQKLVYTVRLLYGAGLADASLGEPSVDEALVYRLGEERLGTVERGGQRYQAIERRYAVLPQRSGPLHIAGPVLNARVSDPAARGGAYGATRPLQRRAPELEAEVQPPPAGAGDPWLPAESLTIDASWVGGTPVFRVGEPVTRTLAITAQGLAAEQLPELTLDASGFQVYPDRSRAETRPEGETLVAQRLMTAAYVPTRPGELTLPETSIAWWDLANDRPALARLPAQRIQVLPALPGAVAASPPASASAPTAQASGQAGAGAGGAGLWPWLALLFGLGWAASATLYWYRRRAVQVASEPAVPLPAAPRPAPAVAAAPTGVSRPAPRQASAGGLPALQQACHAGDAQAARQALLDWAAARWPEDPPRNLEQIGDRLPPAVRPLLQSIDRALYGGGDASWDGEATWTALQPLLAPVAGTRPDAGDGALPPLYPHPAGSR
jgi:hypothetical protein